MTVHEGPRPSKVVEAIQMTLVSKLVADPRAAVIAIDRSEFVILQAALGEMVGLIELVEDRAAMADRLGNEMRTLEADLTMWKTAAERYRAAWGREIDRQRRLRLVGRDAEIVDLAEVLRREQRDAGRPIGQEGGAA